MSGRILIIEDNADNLDLMGYLLAAFGHTPISVTSGEDALPTCRSALPDLVVCDIHLPGKDGYQIARELKADPLCRSIPLVAVTALAMVGDREKVLAAGFDGYLSKPIDPQKFVAQLEEFLPLSARSRKPPSPGRAVQEQNRQQLPHPHSILVVDNLPVQLEFARSLLEPFGFTVYTAEGPISGLELAKAVVPDLILSDINMSEGSGYDFIQSVKADAGLAQIPFVFVTSTMLSNKDRQKGLGLGAAKFLQRPIEPLELVDELKECLDLPSFDETVSK
ncbi:MAG: response regulator [Bdellovibrionales bacterium]|nr:response regulator [Bdellovibrionales bacterium]